MRGMVREAVKDKTVPSHDLCHPGGSNFGQSNNLIKRTLAEQLVCLTIEWGIKVVLVVLRCARMMGKQAVLALA